MSDDHRLSLMRAVNASVAAARNEIASTLCGQSKSSTLSLVRGHRRKLSEPPRRENSGMRFLCSYPRITRDMACEINLLFSEAPTATKSSTVL
jgi:hypothetical protein